MAQLDHSLGQPFLDGVLASEQLTLNSLPPIEQWSPSLNGDLDMRIDREAKWYYLGDEIRRPAMVKMFSRIMKREGDDYFLLTPVEKWRIRIDVAPFLIVAARKELNAQGQPTFVLTSNVEDEFVLGGEHALWMSNLDTQEPEPRPLVMVRNNLPALLSRNVFYQLVDEAELEVVEGRRAMTLQSGGDRFTLGFVD
jgi:hypothetical protein